MTVRHPVHRLVALSVILFLSLGLLSFPVTAAQATDEPIRVSLLHRYDSADDRAIVISVDTVQQIIRLRNYETGRDYTLDYDNATYIYDAAGNALSAGRIPAGEIVSVTFLKNRKHLNSLTLTSIDWVMEDVTNYRLLGTEGMARIGGEAYRMDHRTLILADGVPAYPEDILETDTLRVCGIDHDIYSITVTRGHGYISLSSDQVDENTSLVGAWIELDNQIIRRISPNMLISAPEGHYQLGIRGSRTRFNTEVEVTRGQETVIDTSVVEVTRPKTGAVVFHLLPEDGSIVVDGVPALLDTPNIYEYGEHMLIADAEGYKELRSTLKVGEPSATLTIELSKSEEQEEPEKDASTSASDSSSEDASSSTAETSDSTEASSGDTGSTGASAAGYSSSDSANSTDSGISSDAGSTSQNGSSVNPRTSEGSNPNHANTGSTESSVSTSATTGSTKSSAATTATTKVATGDRVIEGYYISFDAPEDTTAYFDDIYIGEIPISFPKYSGVHSVTLKKKGYKTRSFTIDVDDAETNVIYSFPELISKDYVPVNVDISGNDVSGN